jgi:hypothetical protein
MEAIGHDLAWGTIKHVSEVTEEESRKPIFKITGLEAKMKHEVSRKRRWSVTALNCDSSILCRVVSLQLIRVPNNIFVFESN